MIVGNKCDMEDKRIISLEKGQEVIQFKFISMKSFIFINNSIQIGRHHNIAFMETSAKTNVNIEKAFYDMAKKILDKQPEKKAVPSQGPNIVPGGGNNPSPRPGFNCCQSKSQKKRDLDNFKIERHFILFNVSKLLSLSPLLI